MNTQVSDEQFGMSFLTLFISSIIFYFIPSFIAVIRKKPNRMAIMALNLFLGWSIIGWVVSLVWSLSNGSANQNIIITQPNAPKSNPDKFEELEKLNNLLDKQIISQEEFEIQKSKILNS